MQVAFYSQQFIAQAITPDISDNLRYSILPKEEACNIDIIPSVTTLYMQHYPITFMYTMLPQLFIRVYYTGSATFRYLRYVRIISFTGPGTSMRHFLRGIGLALST